MAAEGSSEAVSGATPRGIISTGQKSYHKWMFSYMSELPTKDREMFLEAEKRRLYEAIRNYPTPIAGCDQQFNYLLEQQAQVTAELHRIRTGTEEPA